MRLEAFAVEPCVHVAAAHGKSYGVGLFAQVVRHDKTTLHVTCSVGGKREALREREEQVLLLAPSPQHLQNVVLSVYMYRVVVWIAYVQREMQLFASVYRFGQVETFGRDLNLARGVEVLHFDIVEILAVVHVYRMQPRSFR